MIRLAQIFTHLSQGFCLRQGGVEIKTPGLVEMKVRRQAGLPLQVGSGPAFAFILIQLLLSLCGCLCWGYSYSPAGLDTSVFCSL